MNPIVSTKVDKPVAFWKCAQYHISLYAPSPSAVSRPSPPGLYGEHGQEWHVVVHKKTNPIVSAILEWPHGKAFQKRLAEKPDQIGLIRDSLQRNFYPVVTKLTNKDGDKKFLVNLFVRGLGGAPPVSNPKKESVSSSLEELENISSVKVVSSTSKPSSPLVSVPKTPFPNTIQELLFFLQKFPPQDARFQVSLAIAEKMISDFFSAWNLGQGDLEVIIFLAECDQSELRELLSNSFAEHMRSFAGHSSSRNSDSMIRIAYVMPYLETRNLDMVRHVLSYGSADRQRKVTEWVSRLNSPSGSIEHLFFLSRWIDWSGDTAIDSGKDLQDIFQSFQIEEYDRFLKSADFPSLFYARYCRDALTRKKEWEEKLREGLRGVAHLNRVSLASYNVFTEENVEGIIETFDLFKGRVCKEDSEKLWYYGLRFMRNFVLNRNFTGLERFFHAESKACGFLATYGLVDLLNEILQVCRDRSTIESAISFMRFLYFREVRESLEDKNNSIKLKQRIYDHLISYHKNLCPQLQKESFQSKWIEQKKDPLGLDAAFFNLEAFPLGVSDISSTGPLFKRAREAYAPVMTSLIGSLNQLSDTKRNGTNWTQKTSCARGPAIALTFLKYILSQTSVKNWRDSASLDKPETNIVNIIVDEGREEFEQIMQGRKTGDSQILGNAKQGAMDIVGSSERLEEENFPLPIKDISNFEERFSLTVLEGIDSLTFTEHGHRQEINENFPRIFLEELHSIQDREEVDFIGAILFYGNFSFGLAIIKQKKGREFVIFDPWGNKTLMGHRYAFIYWSESLETAMDVLRRLNRWRIDLSKVNISVFKKYSLSNEASESSDEKASSISEDSVKSEKHFHEVLYDDGFVRIGGKCSRYSRNEELINGLLDCVKSSERDLEKIGALLDQVDPNIRDAEGNPLICLAMQRDDYALIKCLLEKGADWKINIGENKTPLLCACEWGLLNIVQVLFDEAEKKNEHALINMQRLLNVACYNGRIALVEFLLARGAKIDKLDETDGMTPLMAACVKGDLETVRFLVERKASLKRIGRNKTPLEIASQYGHKEVADFLQQTRKVQKNAGRKTLLRSIKDQWLPFIKEKGEFRYNSFDSLPDSIDQIAALIDKKGVITEEYLNLGVLRGSAAIVEMLIDKGGVPSRLTFHLARFIGNKKILLLLDEVGPLIREEHEAFEKEEFRQFLKYISYTKELDLSGHTEITDEYFAFGGLFSPLPYLQRLRLSGCLKISDRGLEQIAKYFPGLRELDLSLSRNYQDVQPLIAQDFLLSAHRYIERKPGEITERGIGYLAKGCKKLQTLSLACRYGLPNTIAAFLGDSSYFSVLRSLNLSDCYSLEKDAIERIKKAHHPGLKIEEDRLFSGSSIPILLKNIEEKAGKPLNSGSFLGRLYQAINKKDTQEALTLLGEDASTNQADATSLKAPTWEEVLHLAVKESDFLVTDGLLKRGGKIEPEVLSKALSVAICSSKDPQIIAQLLRNHVPVTEDMVLSALECRKNDPILNMLLERFQSPTESFLNDFVVHQYNSFVPVQKFMEKGVEFTDKSLYLAVKFNHLRVAQLFMQHGIHPTEETLNAAVRYNTPRAVTYFLEEGMQPTEQTMQEALNRGLMKVIDLILKHPILYSADTAKRISYLKKKQYPATLPEPDEHLSLEEKKKIVLFGSFESIQRLIEKNGGDEEELFNVAIQRDSYIVVKLFVEKGARSSYLNRQINRFNGVSAISGLLEDCKKENEVPMSEDEMFTKLIDFWERKTDLDLRGWAQLTDVSFSPSQRLSAKLPNVKSLRLAGCSSLNDPTLYYLGESFPHLTTLDISSSPLDLDKKTRKAPLFTKDGIEQLGKCADLQSLSLRFRYDIAGYVGEALMKPNFLPKLQFLNMRDCDELIAQSILKRRPSLQILY